MKAAADIHDSSAKVGDHVQYPAEKHDLAKFNENTSLTSVLQTLMYTMLPMLSCSRCSDEASTSSAFAGLVTHHLATANLAASAGKQSFVLPMIC